MTRAKTHLFVSRWSRLVAGRTAKMAKPAVAAVPIGAPRRRYGSSERINLVRLRAAAEGAVSNVSSGGGRLDRQSWRNRMVVASGSPHARNLPLG